MKKILLDENKNPFMPSASIMKTIKKTAKRIFEYPENYTSKIEQSISKTFNIDTKFAFFGNGSMDIFSNIIDCFGNVKYALFNPTFWGFGYFLFKKNYSKTNEINFSDDYNENLKNIKILAKKSKVFYLCNPNNPSLDYFEKNDLLDIIKANSNCHFVVDETLLTYENFFKQSLYQDVKNLNNLSIIISLSKIFSLAGLRMGIMFSNEEQIKKIKSKQTPYLTNIFAQNIMIQNLNEFKILAEIRKKIYKNYKYLIEKLPVLFYKKIVNRNSCFITICTNEDISLEKLKRFMESKKIFIRYSIDFFDIKKNFVRISAGTKSQYKKLIKSINIFLKKEGYDK